MWQLQALLGLSIVLSGLSSYDVWSPVVCKEGEVTAIGNCISEFQRCRCERWITSHCPGTSVFDANARLCIFDHECLTPPTVTAIPTYTPTLAPQSPEVVTTATYATSGPQYTTEAYTATYSTSGPQYTTETYINTYTPKNNYEATTYMPTLAPQSPEVVPTATYVQTLAPQSPEAVTTATYATDGPQYTTEAYTNNDAAQNTYDTPQNGYEAIAPQNGYEGQAAPLPVYGYPQGLSNPFYVPRRFNRHRHHRGGYWGDDNEYLNWHVFPRSRVRPLSHRKRHHHKNDDSISNTAFALGGVENAPEEDIILESSGVAPEEMLTRDEEVDTSSSRKKRSTQYINQDIPSTKCAGAADNSIFSLGFCAPNFIVCKSSRDLLAACPDGDLFDFEKSRCVPVSACGKLNVDICMVPSTVPPQLPSEVPSYTATNTPIPTVTMPIYVPTTSPPQNPTDAPTMAPYTTVKMAPYATVTTAPYATITTAPYATVTTAAYATITEGTGSTDTMTESAYTKPAPQNPTDAPYIPVYIPKSPEYSAETEKPIISYVTTEAPQYPTNPQWTSTDAPESPTISPYSTSTSADVTEPSHYPAYRESTVSSGVDQLPYMPNYGQFDEPKYIYITVSSNYSDFCEKRRDSLYRDPKSCSSIVQCYNGEMFQHVGCPSGLVFNEEIQQCDYRSSVAECDKPEQDPAGKLYEYFVACLGNNQCNGKNHGAYIPDETNCNIFYRCVWGRLVQMNCPSGTVFNPTLSVCDWLANVPNCLTPAADQQTPY